MEEELFRAFMPLEATPVLRVASMVFNVCVERKRGRGEGDGGWRESSNENGRRSFGSLMSLCACSERRVASERRDKHISRGCTKSSHDLFTYFSFLFLLRATAFAA